MFNPETWIGRFCICMSVFAALALAAVGLVWLKDNASPWAIVAIVAVGCSAFIASLD